MLSLITRPGGKVTAANDAAARRGVYGDACVLDFGEKFRYEIINNNTIRVYDGVAMVQGMHIQIDPNTYEDFLFDNGTQGVTQYDLIGFDVTIGSEYTYGKFVKENVGAAGLPQVNDLWGAPSGTKTQIALYRVKFEGLSITEVNPLFEVANTSKQLAAADEQLKKADEQLKKADEQLKKADEQLAAADEQLKKADEQLKKDLEFLRGKKVLWTGKDYMNELQTAVLTEKISAQQNGAVLVWSGYDSVNNVEQNQFFHTYYVPKELIKLQNNKGHSIILPGTVFSTIGAKYVYISDDKIVGHADNNISSTRNGITFDNKRFVLRYVLGV